MRAHIHSFMLIYKIEMHLYIVIFKKKIILLSFIVVSVSVCCCEIDVYSLLCDIGLDPVWHSIIQPFTLSTCIPILVKFIVNLSEICNATSFQDVDGTDEYSK